MGSIEGAIAIAAITASFSLFTTPAGYAGVLADIATKLKPANDTNEYRLGDGRTEIQVEDKILDYFAIKIAEELNKMNPEERAKKIDEIRKALHEGKNIDVDPEYIDKIQALAASSLTGGTVASLLAGPVTAKIFYSGIFAGLWASAFGMSSSLLLLTGTGVGTLVSLPIFLIFWDLQATGRPYL